jgi:pimeloyl-ACP methyl ester carboxylesterase
MERLKVDGVELEYEVTGTGEPVLLIGTGPIADSFLPFLTAPAAGFRWIRYHQRGQAGSGASPAPVSIARHADDAAALLAHLGIRHAHVAGHSSGAVIALQLALDTPDLVHTLALLEPALLGVPSAAAFFEKAAPAVAAYGAGDREGAMASFLSTVSSLDWDTCRGVIEEHVPGGVAQALRDSETFFTSYLPALQDWKLGPLGAPSLVRPVLSVLGTASEPLFAEGRELKFRNTMLMCWISSKAGAHRLLGRPPARRS